MGRTPTRRTATDRFSLGLAMLLVAGAASGLWLIAEEVRTSPGAGDNSPEFDVRALVPLAVFVLGGLCLIGPPLLLLRARGRPWGAGRLLWFAFGTASWLLWPSMVYRRAILDAPVVSAQSGVCYVYGTPLMVVCITITLLAGGHFTSARRRRMRHSWQETLGLLLGLCWTCIGLLILALGHFFDLFSS